MAMTESWLKSRLNKVCLKPSVHSDRDGLSVRVSSRGKLTFQLRYRYKGKAKRVDIGSYPLISLSEARKKSAQLKGDLEEGRDPQTMKRLKQKEITESLTIEGLFTQWYLKYCKTNKEMHDQVKRTFEIHVLPKIGSLPCDEVTIHHWIELLEGIVRHSESIGERVLVNAKQMVKWGVRRQLISNNPIAQLYAREDFNIKKRVSTRSLSDLEVSKVWMAINKSRMAPKNKVFLKLCLFYGCRGGELRLAEKVHFDLDNKIWTVPPENHKTGKITGQAIVRPIPDEILPLLHEAMALSQHPRYLFTNANSNKPMTDKAPLQLPYNIMQWLRRHDDYSMEHWSVHDLRKTARTNFSKLTDYHVAEVMLGHAIPATQRAYDHYNYVPEQMEAYRKWYFKLSELVGRV